MRRKFGVIDFGVNDHPKILHRYKNLGWEIVPMKNIPSKSYKIIDFYKIHNKKRPV
jgi:nucleoside diphosphate kinase